MCVREVYLNDCEDHEDAGATVFRELNISVSPRKGMALLFFPAFVADRVVGEAGKAGEELRFKAGQGDARTLHAGAPTRLGTKARVVCHSFLSFATLLFSIIISIRTVVFSLGSNPHPPVFI